VLFTKHYYGDRVKEDKSAGHVARMGERRNVNKILVGKTEGKDHSGDLVMEGRIIF
jgi:hypothetical protein